MKLDPTAAPPRLFVPTMREPDYAVTTRADLPPFHWKAQQTAPMAEVCSCGDRVTHEVASRQTSDGKAVSLDSEGQVWLGRQMPLAVGRRLPEPAARLVMDSVGWYSADELPALVSAARWVMAHMWRGHGAALARRVRKLMGEAGQ
jgi:hypothetical protein